MRKVTAYYSFVILIILLTARLTFLRIILHEIRCHEYIISFYIAIFNRPTILQKSVKLIQFIIKREDEALEIAFTPLIWGKTNHGKGDILGLKNGQDCILLMSFSTRVKNNKQMVAATQ